MDEEKFKFLKKLSIISLRYPRGKLEGISEEISSVALLSPACLYFLNDLILEQSQINTKAFIIQDLHNTTKHCLD